MEEIRAEPFGHECNRTRIGAIPNFGPVGCAVRLFALGQVPADAAIPPVALEMLAARALWQVNLASHFQHSTAVASAKTSED